ncbi:MAG: DinB family protein, partial [Dehalococcoidia bacterium]
MTNVVDDLIGQNEWANLRIIEACRALADEQLDATAVGAYGSVRTTLVHMLGAEQQYIRDLGGRPTGPDLRRGFPGWVALEAAARLNASDLVHRLRLTLDTTVTKTFEDDTREEIEAGVLLVQAINHGAEHRSQICTILTTLGATTPEIDGWAWAEAEGRIRVVEGSA